ncbi:MAG: hypothetical protein RL326_199 [Pseudomonadota bacterium]
MKFWSNSDVPPPGGVIPELRLLAAVLQRAIHDFIGGEGDVREGARSWLMDDEPTDAPLSFRFICEALDLDVNSLRTAIGRQAEAQVREFAAAEAAS